MHCSPQRASLRASLGNKHLLTSAYHRKANGPLECFHRQLKDALRARLAGVQWVEHLPWALLGIRAQPKKNSNMSFTELVYGNPLTLPGEAPSQEIVDRIRSAVTSFNPLRVREPPHQRGTASTQEALQQATHMYVLQGEVIPSLGPRKSGAISSPTERVQVFPVGNGCLRRDCLRGQDKATLWHSCGNSGAAFMPRLPSSGGQDS